MNLNFFFWYFKIESFWFFAGPFVTLMLLFLFLTIQSNLKRENCMKDFSNSERTDNENIIIEHYCRECRGKVNISEDSDIKKFKISCK